MMGNEIVVVGNVATDVRQMVTKNGFTRASFRFASTPRRFDKAKEQWVDGKALFVTVICWRALGDNVAESVHKGDPLVVRGRLTTDTWEREPGVEQTDLEIIATSVGHDLNRGTARFQRVSRTSGLSDGAAGAQGGSTGRASVPEPRESADRAEPAEAPWTTGSSTAADGARPRRQEGGGPRDPWATSPTAVEETGERAA